MAFTRKTLSGYGLTEEQLEKVMTLHSTSLADYIPKSDVQAQIDDAVKAAKENIPPADVTKSAEYKELLGERDMLRALGSDDFANVKPKFREAVYKMLDRGENAKPVEEQLKKVAEDYEEYFSEQKEEPPTLPQFGKEVQGGMPKGGQKSSISDIWFGKKQ